MPTFVSASYWPTPESDRQLAGLDPTPVSAQAPSWRLQIPRPRPHGARAYDGRVTARTPPAATLILKER